MLRGLSNGGGGGGGGGATGPDVLTDATVSFNVDGTYTNQTVPVNSTGAVVATIQLDSTVTLPVGTTVTLVRKGTGGASFAPAAGVTFRSPRSYSANAQNSTIVAKKLATNDWVIMGDLL